MADNALKTLFKNIANSIRSKTGETGSIKPSDFPAKITSIQIGSSDAKLMNTIHGLVNKDEALTSGKDGLLTIPTILADNGNIFITANSYALAGFTNALYAKFHNTTWFYAYSLAYCPKLKIVEVEIDDSGQGLGVTFHPYSLYNNTALESIIVRFTGTEFTSTATFGVQLGEGNGILEGTNSTFYIYVSRVMYDAVVASNPKYSSRIRKLEDYPDIDNWYSNL